jgi:hypothetical protein
MGLPAQVTFGDKHLLVLAAAESLGEGLGLKDDSLPLKLIRR